MDIDVDRSDRPEEVLHRLEAIPRLWVVLHIVFGDQLVKGVDVSSAKGVEEAGDRLLVPSGV